MAKRRKYRDALQGDPNFKYHPRTDEDDRRDSELLSRGLKSFMPVYNREVRNRR